MGSPNTLARTKVLGNLFGTTNALNFSSSITVWCEVPAQNAPAMDDTGQLPVSGNPDWGRDVALSAKAAEKRYAPAGSYLDLEKTDQQKVAGPVAFAGQIDFAGKINVPAISDFTGNDALPAKVIDNRYVKSIPVSPNKRVTDIWGNADGRLVFGDGTAAPVLANLSDLLFSDPNLKAQIFRQTITFNNAVVTIPFPKAFKAGTTPYVFIPSYQEINGALWYSVIGICGNTNTGTVVFKLGWGGGTQFLGNTGTVTTDIFALGYFDQ
ncbi:hypothetical protein NKW42_12680 [Acetobacter fabarum]|uniref:hypothetical protein n=1 Tax=Acetobacter fabarum TaxID=483199 RepID=UPI00209FCBB8|nr:hypothetical protein [Acetobacter fabarum]MCP1229265.1 hypothetical protein [Acetobacter fabarum]